MARPARHGPARWLEHDQTAGPRTPLRRRDGAFEVRGPVPTLASGRILVDRLPQGTTIAVPSAYVGHLTAAIEALEAVVVVGDARDMPWPLRGLAGGLADLPDHAPVPHDWLDGPRSQGWRVTAPWQLDAGALGYGRWLPAPVVAHQLERTDGHRHLVGPPEHVLGSLRWHGCHAEAAGPALAASLLGWTAELPNRPLLRRWSEDALL